MVGSVQSTAGSSAYTRGAQLGTTTPFTRRNEDSSTASQSVEKKETVRSTDNRESVTRSNSSTEISNRNEDNVIRAEQVRGSLLDIAV